MTDAAPAPEENPSETPARETSRVRRISNPRPKKPAKAQAGLQETDAAAPAYPVFDLDRPAPEPATENAAESRAPSNDWPVEPETISAESTTGPANPKRKRRRKKGKGSGQQSASMPAADAETTTPLEDAEPPRPAQQHRPKHDADALAKLACKIYLAEVSEEGVALIGDNDARELSRRCFRLAEIFLDEQTRRR